MPVPVLKSYAEQSGKTLAEAEACWEKAKKKANERFKEGDKHKEYWPYVQIMTQMCLGINATSDKEKRKKKEKKKS